MPPTETLLVTELLASSGARSQTFDDLVSARARQLPPPARSFLDYCSIFPRRVSIEQIEASGAADQDIQSCLDTGLLLPEGDGVAFRHELTRHAIEAALSPLRRRQLHKMELKRLDAVRASAARRLHHAIASATRERIVELAPVAAAQAARLGSHGQAVKAWTALIGAFDECQDPTLFEHFAFELHMIGELIEAIDWQNKAIAVHRRTGNELRLGDSLRFRSRLRYMNGERVLADESAQAAIAVLEPLGETAELAHAYDARAHLAVLSGRNDEAIRWCELAAPIAKRLERHDLLSTILNNHGTAVQYRDFDLAIDMLDRSIKLARQTGSHDHEALGHINRSALLFAQPDLKRAEKACDEGIAFCIDHELAAWEQALRGGRAMARFEMGNWQEAVDDAKAALLHPAATGFARNPAIRTIAKSMIRTGISSVAPYLEELAAHGAEGLEILRFNSYAMIAAEHAWTANEDRETAFKLLQAALGRNELNVQSWDTSEIWFWFRKLGSSPAEPTDLVDPFANLASGNVAATAAAMRRLNKPFEEALALVEGDDDQIETGLRILDQLGAEATITRVRADLAARGMRRGTRGPRSSTKDNPYGLTRREMDVLRHIDAGLSNKEIGDELFVSPKTVDHHVCAILSKTETRSRGEAAALARRDNLLS